MLGKSKGWFQGIPRRPSRGGESYPGPATTIPTSALQTELRFCCDIRWFKKKNGSSPVPGKPWGARPESLPGLWGPGKQGEAQAAGAVVAWGWEGAEWTVNKTTAQARKSMGNMESQVVTQGAGLRQDRGQKAFWPLRSTISAKVVGVRHSGQCPLQRLSSWFLENQPLPGSLLPAQQLLLCLPWWSLCPSLLHAWMSATWPLLYFHTILSGFPRPKHGFKHHLYAEASEFLSHLWLPPAADLNRLTTLLDHE